MNSIERGDNPQEAFVNAFNNLVLSDSLELTPDTLPGLPSGALFRCYQDLAHNSNGAERLSYGGKRARYTLVDGDQRGNKSVRRSYGPQPLNRFSFAVAYFPDGNNGQGDAALYDLSPQEPLHPPSEKSEGTITDPDIVETIFGLEDFTNTSIPGIVRDPLIVASLIEQDTRDAERERRGRYPDRTFTKAEPTLELVVDLANPTTKILSVDEQKYGYGTSFSRYIIDVAGAAQRRLVAGRDGLFVTKREGKVATLETTPLADVQVDEEHPLRLVIVLNESGLTNSSVYTKEYLRSRLVSGLRESVRRSYKNLQPFETPPAVVGRDFRPNDPSYSELSAVFLDDCTFRDSTASFITAHLAGQDGQAVLTQLFQEHGGSPLSPQEYLRALAVAELRTAAEEVLQGQRTIEPWKTGFTNVWRALPAAHR